MVIKNKSSIYKKLYELNGQKSMFGHDNIHFKTVNLPNKQRYINLCSKFGLKKIYRTKSINIPFISVN